MHSAASLAVDRLGPCGRNTTPAAVRSCYPLCLALPGWRVDWERGVAGHRDAVCARYAATLGSAAAAMRCAGNGAGCVG